MATRKSNSNNVRNIYEIPGGYYLNIEFAGEVYREAFMAARYGSLPKALSAAIDLRDLLNMLRAEIEQAVVTTRLDPGDETRSSKWLADMVRQRVAEMSPADRAMAARAVKQPAALRVRSNAATVEGAASS